MPRCLDCGAEFDEPKYFTESRGEHFGFPARITFLGCPYCAGDYTENEEEETEVEEEDEC